MKIRNGFVSNSSTSSFICVICGGAEGYSDCVSMEEAGGYRCINGHIFHIDCVSKYELEKVDDEYYGGTSVSEETCPVCALKVLTDWDKLNFLFKKVGMTDEEILNALREEREST